MGSNALQFAFSMGFILLYQMFFGMENVLAGVAISVGLTMFPEMPVGLCPRSMALITVGLYVGAGAAAQLALVDPWLALPLNFFFTLVLMLLTCEPLVMKPSISFLLCFVFCQATPVPAESYPTRFLGTLLGGLLVAAVTVISWRKKGYSENGRTIKAQITLGAQNMGYILRMSVGLAFAMFIGMFLDLQKPLWISIVVMSLTQLEFHETVERIKHRSLATVVGALLFILFFQIIFPREYAFLLILLLGYISYFTPQYKHKQIVNTINAINASMVLLDTTTAITSRALCLVGGVTIVLLLFLAEHLVQLFVNQRQENSSGDAGALTAG